MNSPVKNHSPGYFVGYLIAMLCAFLLTACGGGGGSPGSVPNQPTPTPTQSVASLVITTSADTLSSSGAAGSEVTVTVLARDKNNNAVADAAITLSANSGAITYVVPDSSTAKPGVTDASGTVTAKLSTAGVSTLRVITLSATAGTVAATPKTVTVVQSNASLTIVTSSDELPSSGSINVTVFAKDGSNNVIRGAKVNLSATTGLLNISPTDGRTGTDGTITATLTSPGDTSQRNITLTATLDPAAGISDRAEKVVKVVSAVPTLQITASSGTLKSSGASGTEVTVNVLVRDAGNNVKEGVAVNLTADSGALTFTSRRSSAQGLVSEKLSTGNDPKNRVITVTASADGVEPVRLQVTVSGTTISLNSSSSVSASTAAKMTAILLDSSGTPLQGKLVTASTSSGGTVTVKNNGLTDSNGSVELSYTAPATGSTDRVTVSALGDSKYKDVVINRTNFNISGPVDAQNETKGLINTCYPLTVHSDNNGTPTTGTVSVSISRGAIFTDANCRTPSSGQLTFNGSGNASAFMQSPTPGVAGLVATLPSNISVQGSFKFTAPLVSTANITLSADPSVIGVGGEQAAVRAVVRDGTASNNLVSGATVNFTITADNSGGTLSVPASVVTGDDGVATVTYNSGASATATNGVTIKAELPAIGVSNTTQLTVGRRSLFLSAGTGIALGTPSNEAYQLNYQVFAADAAGNAVSGANITASVIPTQYAKGVMSFRSGFWSPTTASVACANEDVNKNGILDAGEDINSNGRLEPGIPIVVTPTVQTDSKGVATISLMYARDRAYWLNVNLTITATVSGSEAKYVASFVLPGLSTDFNKIDVIPPGVNSPYGIVTDTEIVAPFRTPCQIPN